MLLKYLLSVLISSLNATLYQMARYGSLWFGTVMSTLDKDDPRPPTYYLWSQVAEDTVRHAAIGGTGDRIAILLPADLGKGSRSLFQPLTECSVL